MPTPLCNALYVVSTPIGNLDDLSIRAIEVLKTVDAIACEDKRHSSRLLRHHSVENTLLAYHEHSGPRDADAILARLGNGESIALISDAGTPLVADPGYKLVNQVVDSGFDVIAIPGASAMLAALAVSGLATDRFAFEGFLPARQEAREKRLSALQAEPRTLVFYETPHRILETLQAMSRILGEDRKIVLARELTKRFETKLRGDLASVTQQVTDDADQRRGEFVLMVTGHKDLVEAGEVPKEARQVLSVLMQELPLKQASSLAAKITGVKKNALYKWGLTESGA